MLDKVRANLGALNVDELKQLRDEIGDLLMLYGAGGAVTGWGSLERKWIPKRRVATTDEGEPILNVGEDGEFIFDEKTGKPYKYETVYYGPYLYVRRWTVDQSGRRRLRTVGYYGRAGVEALDRGLGDQLLEAHNTGGEQKGEEFLLEQDLAVDLPERWGNGGYPESPPKHPLPGLRMDSHKLEAHTLFGYFVQHAPAAAKALLTALHDYEVDRATYQIAQEDGLVFRIPNAELKQRREFSRLYKESPRPKFRVRRRT